MKDEYDLVVKQARLLHKESLQDIAISDGLIVAVEKDLDVKSQRSLNVEGRVLIPGFVDLHMHLDKAIMGGELKWECVDVKDMIMAS